MFDRFDDEAKSVLVPAMRHAQHRAAEGIGADDLLLAIFIEGRLAQRSLVAAGLDLDDARTSVERHLGPPHMLGGGPIGYTPEARRALNAVGRWTATHPGHLVDSGVLLTAILAECADTIWVSTLGVDLVALDAALRQERATLS